MADFLSAVSPLPPACIATRVGTCLVFPGGLLSHVPVDRPFDIVAPHTFCLEVFVCSPSNRTAPRYFFPGSRARLAVWGLSPPCGWRVGFGILSPLRTLSSFLGGASLPFLPLRPGGLSVPPPALHLATQHGELFYLLAPPWSGGFCPIYNRTLRSLTTHSGFFRHLHSPPGHSSFSLPPGMALSDCASDLVTCFGDWSIRK